jgi:predicted branched-subunit amino acid permease
VPKLPKRQPKKSSSEPTTAESFWCGVKAGMGSMQGVVLFASYIGFGGLCASIDFPMGAAIFSSAMIIALPSQLLLIAGFAAHSTLPVIAVSAFLSAARLLPSTVTLLPYLRTKFWLQLIASHFVAVSIWVESHRLLPPLPPKGRVPFYFGLALYFNGGGVLCTWIGYLLAGGLPEAFAIGLGFLTPMSFMIALTRNARDLVDRLSLIFGLVFAPLFAWLNAPLELLWVGLFGGGAAILVHKRRRKKKAA